jgi:ketopantoate reductase
MRITVFGAGGIGGQVVARMSLSGRAINVVAKGPDLDAIRGSVRWKSTGQY